MGALALAVGCLAISADYSKWQTTIKDQQAPDPIVAEWAVGPGTGLRNVRGRVAIVFLYHTAC